jgi:hypothetical protein
MAVTLISNESVIGTLTPNVYVNRITLENTGTTNLNNKNDSVVSIHTDNSGMQAAVDEVIASGGTLEDSMATWAAILENTLQQQLYTNPASMKYSDSKLKVKIDLVLKEAGGGLAEFWADKSEVNEYVKVGYAYSTNSLATKILSVGSNLLRLKKASGADLAQIQYSIGTLIKNNVLNDIEKQTLMSEMGVLESSFKFPFTAVAHDGTAAQYTNKVYSFMVKNVTFNLPSMNESLFDIMKKQTGVYENTNIPYVEVDADGNKIKNYKFSIEYIHDSNKPPHLSFVVLSYLDLEKMKEDFDIDFSGIIKTPHGKLIYEQIIDNYEVNTKSFVYVNPVNNNIWAGPVHMTTPDPTNRATAIWRTGFSETPDSFAVVRKVFTNTKIQDFRTVERIEKLNFDLSFLETSVFNRGMSTKHITRDKTDVAKQPAYFTPFYSSRDPAGNCRYMFGMDYYTLLLENTLFGKLWGPRVTPTQLTTGQGIKAYTKLISLKLKRRRVNKVLGATPLGSFNAVEKPFKTGYLGESHIGTEEIVETIASGRDEVWSAPFRTSMFKYGNENRGLEYAGHFAEKYITFPMGASSHPNLSHGVRFFSGIDTEMASITDGLYQYGVELEIIDNTVRYILGEIKKLYNHYQELCYYYDDAITPTAYDYKNNRFRKGFDNKWKNTGTVQLNQGATYTATTAGTTTTYGELQTKVIKLPGKPWEGAIADLVDVINRFRPPTQAISGDSTLQPFNMASVASSLTMISNSSTGTPRGINTLRTLILDTCSKLAKMAGTSLKEYDDNPHTDDQNSLSTAKSATYKSGATDKRRIKIDYWFPSSFDSDIPKNVGYDYLTSQQFNTDKGTGLLSITGLEFKNRIAKELLKYFTTTTFDNGKFEISSGFTGMHYTPGDTPNTTGYTFFSPSKISLGRPPSGARADSAPIPFIPLNLGTFNTVVDSAGSTTMGPGLDKTEAIEIKKTSWSLLNGGVSLDNAKTFSFIATKIMNYNYSGRLHYADTVSTQNTQNLKIFSKLASKIKFNLNEILAAKNCTAVLQEVDPTDLNLPTMTPADDYFEGGTISQGIPVLPSLQMPDPLEDNLTPEDRELNPLEIGHAAGAENFLFLALAYYFSGGCKSQVSDLSGLTSKQLKDFNINFFNLTGKPGTIIPLLQAQTSGGNAGVASLLQTLPNAIKSLLLFNKGSNRYDWSKDQDLTSNANYKGAFALNYQNIKKVQVLRGFENSSNGNILINSPKWTALTRNMFVQQTGNSLLCRLVTYKNEACGVKMSRCLDLPVFYEYFILNPSDAEQTITVTPPVGGPPSTSVPTLDGASGDLSDYSSDGVGISEELPGTSGTSQGNIGAGGASSTAAQNAAIAAAAGASTGGAAVAGGATGDMTTDMG